MSPATTAKPAKEKAQNRQDALAAFLTSEKNHVVHHQKDDTFEKARTMDADKFRAHFKSAVKSLSGIGWPARRKARKAT